MSPRMARTSEAPGEIGDLAGLLRPGGAREILLGAGLRIHTAVVDYVRIKPGESAVAGLRMEGGGGGGESISLPGYVRTFRRPERAREVARKWARMCPRPTPIGPGVCLLPGDRSLLFVFPNDMRLRGLPFVAGIDKLKRILAEARGIGGAGWRVRGRKSRIEPVRYKPERRYIARLDLALRNDRTGEKARRAAFLRFFTDDRGGRIASIARAIRAAHAAPMVPRPLGLALGGRVFLEEEAPGREMEAALAASPDPGIGARVARRLRALHETPGIAAPPRPASGVLEGARRALAALGAAGLLETGRTARIEASLAAIVPAPVEPRPIHGDFHLHQVLIGPDGPLFVDLERFGLGDPLQDVGNFVAHLRAYGDRDPGGRPLFAAVEEGFLGAYFEGFPARRDRDLAFHVSCGLLEIALLRYRHLEPDRAEAALRIAAMVEETLACPLPPPPSASGPPSLPCDSLDALDGAGRRWGALYPRRRGPWPGYLVERGGGRLHGRFDPTSGAFEPCRPEDDPVLQGHLDLLERGDLAAYRPGRRAVVRIDAPDGPRFVKLLPARKARRIAGIHAALASLRGLPEAFPSFPEIIEERPDEGVMVYRALGGIPLHRTLMRGTGRTDLARVGKALAALHLPVPPPVEWLERGSATTLGDWVAFVGPHYPSLAPLYREILEGVEDASDALLAGGVPARLVHGDLHDRNVYLDGERVSLLDLDSLSAGDPALDVGNLEAQLVLRALQRGAGVEEGRRDARALEGAYLAAGGGARPGRVRARAARSLLRLGCVYLFRRKWRHLAADVAREARGWLDAG